LRRSRLSILVDAFEPERRAWAIGMWATIAGFGFGLGPVLGGALIEAFDWSAIFWVNVPIGLAGLLATVTHVRESRDPNARRLDLGGAALASGALFCLTLGLVETDDHSWTSAFTLAFLGAAVALGAAFLVFEARHHERAPPGVLPAPGIHHREPRLLPHVCGSGRGPLLRLAVLPERQGLLGARNRLLVADDERPLHSRLAVRRSPTGAVRLAPGGRRRRAPGGARVLDFALLGLDSPFLQAVPGYFLVGVGFGSAVPAISAVAMGAIEVERAGVASGVLNTARQVGSAVGLAALGSIATAAAAGSLTKPDNFVSGMRAAMLVAGALALAASVLTLVGQPRATRRAAG
jgi:MFS family permease